MGESVAAIRARPARARRLTRALAVGTLALAAAAAFAYATRSQLLLPWIAARLAAELRARYGIELAHGALSGDLLTRLELRELSLTDTRPEASVPRAEIGWLRLRYDAWDLVRGRWRGLMDVEASRVRLELRARPSDTPQEGGAVAWRMPTDLPTARLRDVALRLDHGAGSLRLAGADLDLAAASDGAHALDLRAAQAAYALADGRAGNAALSAEFRLRGTRIELSRLELDGVERARSTWVELERAAQGEFAWGGVLAPAQGELTHAGTWRAGALSLELSPHGVRLGPPLALLWPALALPDALLDGTLRLDHEPARPEGLRVSWTGRMQDVRWAGRELERLDGEAAYERGRLSIARLEAASAHDSLRASDVSLPLGAGWIESLRGAEGTLRLESADLPSLLRGLAESERLEALGAYVPAHRLELALRVEPGRVHVEGGSLVLPDGSLRLGSGRLGLGADGLRDAEIDVDVEFGFRDLAGLARLFGAPRAWSGALAGRLHLRGELERPQGALELKGREVVAAGVALGEVAARADIDRERLRVSTFRAGGSACRVDARGAWAFAAGGLEDVELELALPDVAGLSGGRLESGALELRARLSGALDDPAGSLELDARAWRGPLLRGASLVALSAAARLEPGRVQVERCSAELDGVALEAAGTLAHARWSWPLSLALERLVARRGALDLALVSPARVELQRGFARVADLHARGSAGELRLDLALDGDALDVDLRGDGLDPMPLLAPFLPEGAELSGLTCALALRRRGADLALEAELDAARLRPAAGLPEVSLRARGALADGRVRLDHLRVDSAAGALLSLEGQAPLRVGAADPLGPGPLSMRGSLDLRALDELPWERLGFALPLSGDLGLDLALQGDWDALAGSVELRGERLAIVSARTRTELLGPARLTGRIALEPSLVRLTELEFRAPGQAALTARGSLAARLRPRAWLAGNDGGLFDGALEAVLHLEADELAVTSRLAASVRRLDGALDGRVSLGGTPRAPTANGSLAVRDGELRLAGDLPGLVGLNGRLEFTHERLAVTELRAELGGGPIAASGSIAWVRGEPVFDLELTGREVLLVQRPELRLRSDVDLTVRGPLSALAVAGDLGLRDGRWSKRIEFYRPDREVRAAPPTELSLFRFDEPPFSNLRLDVGIRSPQPFVIANNLVKGELFCDLRLSGTGRAPDLAGSLFVGTTYVSLPASNLTSQGGTIRFERDDPLVPRLDVRFATRTRGYDVQLHLSGTSLEPEVELSSTPPMSDEDLLLLVLTGKLPQSPWSDAGGQDAFENVAFFIGRDVLDGWFGGDSEGESFLDRIDWRTGVDVSQTGAKTTEFSFRLAGPEAGPGRTLLLRAEQDIYDRTNFGLRFVLRRGD
jgi:translocation and assembly module TamB